MNFQYDSRLGYKKGASVTVLNWELDDRDLLRRNIAGRLKVDKKCYVEICRKIVLSCKYTQIQA